MPGHARYAFHLRVQPVAFQGFRGIEYEVRRSARGRARADQAAWGVPLSLDPQPSLQRANREDLAIRFRLPPRGPGPRRTYKQRHTFYHRMVALSLLPTYWDARGRLLLHPYMVPRDRWGSFEVHHLGNPHDDRLENLAVLRKALHVRVTAGVVRLAMPPGGQQRAPHSFLA